MEESILVVLPKTNLGSKVDSLIIVLFGEDNFILPWTCSIMPVLFSAITVVFRGK